MLKVSSVGAALLFLSASGALGQEMCGQEPIGPQIPKPAEIAQMTPAAADSAKHAAFNDIRQWQGALKSYRDCLDATVATDKRKISEAQRGDKPDNDKIGKLNQEIASTNHDYDQSTNDEELVVNSWNALSVAYCGRTDVDKSTCPKRE